uniref:Uncharacterized protein n=1 Tax=Coccolithus braarudii TaxID=221442 RepID=A0A7S0Q0C4_9EUKA
MAAVVREKVAEVEMVVGVGELARVAVAPVHHCTKWSAGRLAGAVRAAGTRRCSRPDRPADGDGCMPPNQTVGAAGSTALAATARGAGSMAWVVAVMAEAEAEAS